MKELSTNICPLLGAGPLGVNTDCKGGRCAWWEEERDCCALVSMGQSLNGMDRHGIRTFEG